MECPLCDVRKAHGDSQLIYEDALVFVIMNLEQVKDGHVMILPVRHVRTLSDLNPEESVAFHRHCDMAMEMVEKLYPEDGPICVVSGWKHRSQEHLHAHVIPSKHSPRELFAYAEGTPLRTPLSPEMMKDRSERIRAYYQEHLPS